MTDIRGTYGRPYTERARRAQRVATDLHVATYQLSNGRLTSTLFGLPMLLLSTWGRKTGQLRIAPLLYLAFDETIVLVGSNGGAPRSPTWYLNLLDNPHVLVQIGAQRSEAIAEPVPAAERERYWPRLLEVYPPYATYQQRTDREIPLVRLALRPNRHGVSQLAAPTQARG